MTTVTKTYIAKASELRPEWHLIDASGITLGRLSTDVAALLQGKKKPIYTRHMNTGDFVVVINASKIKVTGDKLAQKTYYRHSGYPGGLHERKLYQQMEKFPERVIEHSVKGMLPRTKLGKSMFRRLKVYAGDTHPHEAQIKVGFKDQGTAPEENPSEEKET